MLIGREDELERINDAVKNRALVVFDAYSGVGKSSLLQNGLLGRLERTGYEVLVGRKWARVLTNWDGSDAVVEHYVARSILATHTDRVAPIRLPVALTGMDNSDDKFGKAAGLLIKGGQAVLILDQFEELLRQHGPVAKDVVKWIINLGYRQRTRVVISLRTDSLHHLEPLLRGVKPFAMDRVHIEEVIDPNAIKGVIQTGRQPRLARMNPADVIHSDRGDVELISDEAATQLLALWESQTPRPKLLDLQATLYAVYFHAKELRSNFPDTAEQKIRIEAADVSAFVEKAAHQTRAGGHSDPFAFGLYESISLKIQHAERASRDTNLDEYLVAGTREVIRRTVPHLSSSGFKVQIHKSELARRVLARELRVLEGAILTEWDHTPGRTSGAMVKEIVHCLFQLLSNTDDFLRARSSEVLSHAPGYRATQSGHGLLNGVQRLVGVTAGPMMSTTATTALLEELRRVAFALEWLEATEIVRTDPDGTLLLVHDRSGVALNAWEDLQEESPRYALRQLTAARGEHYVWPHPIGGDACLVVPNLNWRECRISASFRNVVFVNCDFAGSRFDSCRFQGVTFVNCILDDANFESCVIVGRTNLEPISRRTPQTQTLASGHLPTQAPQAVTPATGGVAMVGGRLCFLTLYRCESEDDGSFAFDHVSGSGLDIVEQYGGKIGIDDSAIRGISITRDTNSTEDGPGRAAQVDLSINDSIVANVYFAGELRGTAIFKDTIVLMLVNASKNVEEGFQVHISDCRHQFVANTCEPDSDSVEDSGPRVSDDRRYFSRISASDSQFRVPNRELLAEDLEAMDFRFHPEAWEAVQRASRARLGESKKTRLAPSFTVEAPEEQVRHFASYLESDVPKEPQFFSDTSGAAARPGDAPDNFQGDLIAHYVTTWTPRP